MLHRSEGLHCTLGLICSWLSTYDCINHNTTEIKKERNGCVRILALALALAKPRELQLNACSISLSKSTLHVVVTAITLPSDRWQKLETMQRLSF